MKDGWTNEKQSSNHRCTNNNISICCFIPVETLKNKGRIICFQFYEGKKGWTGETGNCLLWDFSA